VEFAQTSRGTRVRMSKRAAGPGFG
jgi:hypothetical protein